MNTETMLLEIYLNEGILSANAASYAKGEISFAEYREREAEIYTR